MFGLLNLNKPSGHTSREAVNAVQALARPARVGHAGTLDPLASGVLVVCVGPATRLVPYVQQMPKKYLATFELGRRSISDDVEEEVEVLPEDPRPSQTAIVAAIPKFQGTISQRPPIFSALKVAGKRAYKLARAGAVPEMRLREVEIYSLELVSYDYPTLVLNITCGSGTYVRSLGRDLAESLGTHAVMSALQRTAIGSFEVGSAISPADLNQATLRSHLLPARLALHDLPEITVTEADHRQLSQGLDIHRPDHGFQGEIGAVDESGELVGIVKPRSADLLRPTRNFKPS